MGDEPPRQITTALAPAKVEWLAAAPRRPRVEWLAAGPGATRDYFFDIPPIDAGPFTIGGQENVRFGVPMQALVGDAVAYLKPHVPELVDEAMKRATLYLPQAASQAAADAWPTVVALARRDVPGFIAENLPALKEAARIEETRVIRKLYLFGGVLLVGMAGVLWYFGRGIKP